MSGFLYWLVFEEVGCCGYVGCLFLCCICLFLYMVILVLCSVFFRCLFLWQVVYFMEKLSIVFGQNWLLSFISLCKFFISVVLVCVLVLGSSMVNLLLLMCVVCVGLLMVLLSILLVCFSSVLFVVWLSWLFMFFKLFRLIMMIVIGNGLLCFSWLILFMQNEWFFSLVSMLCLFRYLRYDLVFLCVVMLVSVSSIMF